MTQRSGGDPKRRPDLGDAAYGHPVSRLLPWTGESGQPAYLSSDQPGPLWKLADQMEAVQLGLAGALLGHVRAVLAGPEASPQELCFLIARLTEALLDALRVARSRGDRLSPPAPILDSPGELTEAAARGFYTFRPGETK